MQQESPELVFLTLFVLISFFVTLIVQKFSYKIGNGVLLDKDFNKPQAFHTRATPRCGGLSSIISLIIFFGIYHLLFSEFLSVYFAVSLSLFFLGFLDDIKIDINPSVRLTLMIATLLSVTVFFSLGLKNIDLKFLDYLFQSKFFLITFVVLCFLFIINGANLIDGFNGLLIINLLIINSILLYINIKFNFFEFSIVLIGQIIAMLSFLLFNFPKAKIFLGDSGSYLFGSLTALNTINTNNLNPQISSYFFCILLFYLFFEVFFSFFRKLYLKKSPLKPDSKHLHMYVNKYIQKYRNTKNNNAYTSLIINTFFLIMVLPSIMFINNGLICKIWFLILIIIYLASYFYLNKKIN